MAEVIVWSEAFSYGQGCCQESYQSQHHPVCRQNSEPPPCPEPDGEGHQWATRASHLECLACEEISAQYEEDVHCQVAVAQWAAVVVSGLQTAVVGDDGERRRYPKQVEAQDSWRSIVIQKSLNDCAASLRDSPARRLRLTRRRRPHPAANRLGGRTHSSA